MSFSKHLHETGVYNSPSPHVMDPYSTTYSRTHDFSKSADLSGNFHVPDIPTSGFVHGHKRTNTANTNSRYCGQNITAQMARDNEYPPMFSSYTQQMQDPSYISLQKSGMRSLLDVPVHNPRSLDNLAKIEGPTAGGYNRNQANKNIPYPFDSKSESSSQMVHVHQPHDKFRATNPPWTLAKSGNGYLKNHIPFHSTKLSPEISADWMTSTNVQKEQQTVFALEKMSSEGNSAKKGNPEISAFSRQIREPPAWGVGTEETKLRGKQSKVQGGLSNHADASRPFTSPYDLLPYQSASQAYYNISKVRKQNLIEYNYNLRGANPWSTTQQLAQAHVTKLTQHTVPDLPGFASANNVGSKSEGKFYAKDLSSMYCTTKNRDERFFARLQAEVSNQPSEGMPVRSTSGFSVNNKATYRGLGEGVGPAQTMNRETGMHVFGGEINAVGTEKQPFLTTNCVLGHGNLLDQPPIPQTGEIKRNFTNGALNTQSGFGREAINPPLPLKALKGGDFADNPNVIVPGTRGKILLAYEPAVSKNWGVGV